MKRGSVAPEALASVGAAGTTNIGLRVKPQAENATSRFKLPATSIAPGRPIAGTSQNVASSAPKAAPALLLK